MVRIILQNPVSNLTLKRGEQWHQFKENNLVLAA